MTLFGAVGAAVLIGITLAVLRESGGRMVVGVTVGGGLLLAAYALSRLGGVLGGFRELATGTELSPYLTLILKAIGVGYTVELGADICRDLGAESIAKRMEMLGRVELLLLALPPTTELIRLACDMLEGI